MSNNAPIQGLGWLTTGGTPRDIGVALGRMGRAAVCQHLLAHPLWQTVNSEELASSVAAMADRVRVRFPAIWEEILGLAEGLEVPVKEVFAWNCRGDLLASVPDGCTTVMVPRAEPLIAHNEDGFPFFKGACFIAEIRPVGAPTFHAFCYPGSLPGHTFAFNSAGLVQTVNNMRLTGVKATMPRMVLGRAILSARTIAAALDVLENAPSGGFHFALMHQADGRIVSVEFGGGSCSIKEITEPAAHANHALHLERGLSAQIITDSSRDRQARATELLRSTPDPLEILRDVGGRGLPIRRDEADDSDEENTLGTAVLQLTRQGLCWSIHDRIDGPARFTSAA
ncbi:MAG: C45 family peptidase [Marivita lacus]|jgi:hypothetical protein|nr:C45 family peptidase [Marivita lacus]